MHLYEGCRDIKPLLLVGRALRPKLQKCDLQTVVKGSRASGLDQGDPNQTDAHCGDGVLLFAARIRCGPPDSHIQ